MNTSVKKSKKNALGRGYASLLGSNIEQETEVEAKTKVVQETPQVSGFNSVIKNNDLESLKTNVENQVLQLPIEKLFNNKEQPRKKFDKLKLEQLSQSIKENGVIQPITVKKLNDNRYEIVAGERRWRASQLAGLHKVPAIVKKYSEQKTLEVALIENIQRENLNPIEEAFAYKHLIDEFTLTQAEVAKKVGKERATVANLLRLLNLAPDAMEMVKNNEISIGHAKLLLSVEDKRLQFKIARKIFKSSLSVKQASKLIKRLQGDKAVSNNEINSGMSKQIKVLEQEMQKILGTKVILNYDKGKSKMQIQFYSVSELNNFVNNLRDHWKK